MNIFASLKTLLMPGATGTPVGSSPANSSGDFAALLSTVETDGGSVPIAGPVMPDASLPAGALPPPADLARPTAAPVDVAAIPTKPPAATAQGEEIAARPPIPTQPIAAALDQVQPSAPPTLVIRSGPAHAPAMPLQRSGPFLPADPDLAPADADPDSDSVEATMVVQDQSPSVGPVASAPLAMLAQPAPTGPAPAALDRTTTARPSALGSPATPLPSMATSVAASTLPDGVVAPLPDITSPPADPARPIRSEALSLLQLVRDQITGRQPAREQVAAAVAATSEPASPPATDSGASPAALPVSSAPASFSPASPVPPLVVQLPQAAPDIGSTLAASVVTMGVHGQWIDGLARDIAGLSANGAQGSFQISSAALGPVQVDIRQGIDGANISLTAASESAATALRQDSDRLRSDAALASVRIADIRIDRATTPAEAPRSDSGSQQNSPQSQNSMAQGGQSQGMNQGRHQPRENFAAQHKAGGEPAVLNHVDARENAQRGGRTAGRARYA